MDKLSDAMAEAECERYLKSQSATSSLDENTHGGRRKLSFAFMEQRIAMLSSILRSGVAVQAGIRIMDTFVVLIINHTWA